MAMPRHEQGHEPEWKRLLRDALGGPLLDVRVLEERGEFDFLLVHPEGRRRDAIRAFASAMLKAPDGDIPPHTIITADERRAGEAW